MSSITDNMADFASYQEWERRAGPGMRARYADFAPRQPIFEVRPQDIPTTLAGYRVQASGPGQLTVAREGVAITVNGLSAADLASALSLLDGKTTVLELSGVANPRWPLPVWCQLLQALLGTAVDLPGTFSAIPRATAACGLAQLLGKQRGHTPPFAVALPLAE
jgi:hypothetical protein